MVLVASLGGVTYAWGSTFIVSLGIAAVVMIALFILVERRSKEPVLPLRLFRNPIFTMTSAIGFIVGFAMFGAITFLPLYLQVVQRVTPTNSGLRLLPMLAGMLLTSITSGQLISRWGRYKVFPIAGTVVMGAGMYLLSLLDVNTSTLTMSIYMFVLGLGLGMVMQVLVIAVQNAVEFRDLGTATSGATFFRSIGGAFGVAVFGELFANALNTNLAKALSANSLPPGFNPRAAMANPQLLQSLPLSVIGGYLHAFALSLHTVFTYAIPFAAIGLLLSVFLKEAPLRMTTNPGNVEGVATTPSSFEHSDKRSVSGQANGLTNAPATFTLANPIETIEQAVSSIASREKRLTLYEHIAAWAQIPLDPWSTSLLIQIGRSAPVSLEELGQKQMVKPASMELALETLIRGDLVTAEKDINHHGQIQMTENGRLTYERLVEGRQQGLRQVFADWTPEQYVALAEMLNKLTIFLSNDGHDLAVALKPIRQNES